MKVLKNIIRKILCADFLGYVYFTLKCFFKLYLSKNTKADYMLKKFEYTQKLLDKVNIVSDNIKTDKLLQVINSNNKEFKGFYAKFEPNKHGSGNHGLKLSYDNKIGNQKYKVGVGLNGTGPTVDFRFEI